MFVSCSRTKPKLHVCRTLYILKVIQTLIQIGIYKLSHNFFKMTAVTNTEMTNIYLKYQINVIIRPVRVVQKSCNTYQ